MNRYLSISVWIVVACVLDAGCNEDVPLAPPPAPRKPKAAEAVGGSPTDQAVVELKRVVYRDDDFVESDRNRDPFRSFSRLFSVKSPETAQRNVAMPNTAIEDMRLIGIVSGTTKPRAMLVDPQGVGHVVERGVYIGRPQVVQATENVQMMLHWRVDRIRENEVVLTREDPTDPTRPPLTRVVPLREGEPDTSG